MPGAKPGLFVRVQNGSAARPGNCGRPASASFVAFAPVGPGGDVQPLRARAPVFSPALTDFEQTAEDPRWAPNRQRLQPCT